MHRAHTESATWVQPIIFGHQHHQSDAAHSVGLGAYSGTRLPLAFRCDTVSEGGEELRIRHTKTTGIQGSMPTLTAVPGGMYGAARIHGVLAAGQTAHLAVLCARLVHECAVEAGPHS